MAYSKVDNSAFFGIILQAKIMERESHIKHLKDLPIERLQARHNTLTSAQLAFEIVAKTIGTEQFSENSTTSLSPLGIAHPEYSLQDESRITYIEDAKSAATAKKGITQITQPGLNRLVELSSAVLSDIDYLSKQAERIQNDIRQLTDFHNEGFLSTTRPIEVARKRLQEIKDRIDSLQPAPLPDTKRTTKTRTTKSAEAAPAAVNTQPRADEFLLPNGERIETRHKNARIILDALAQGISDPANTTLLMFGEDSQARRDALESWIKKVEIESLEPSGYCVIRTEHNGIPYIFMGKAEDRERLLKEKEQEFARQDRQSKSKNSQEPTEQKEVATTRIEALEYIFTSPEYNRDRLIQILGPSSLGRRLGWKSAHMALSRALHTVHYRVTNGSASDEERRVHADFLRTVGLEESSLQSVRRFTKFLGEVLRDNASFSIQDAQKNEADTRQQRDDDADVLDNASSEEAEIVPLNVREIAVLGALIKSGAERTILSPAGETVQHAIPAAILARCAEVLELSKQELPSQEGDNLYDERQAILSKLQVNLENVEDALGFLDAHSESEAVQDIINWLESEGEYMFEILSRESAIPAGREIPKRGITISQGSFDALKQSFEPKEDSSEVPQTPDHGELIDPVPTHTEVPTTPPLSTPIADASETLKQETQSRIYSAVKGFETMVNDALETVLDVAMLVKPSNFRQITTGIATLTMKDINQAIAQGFINPNTGKDGHHMLTRQEVAIVIIRKELIRRKISLTSQLKGELQKAVEKRESEMLRENSEK